MSMPPLPRQLNTDDPAEIAAVLRQVVDYLHRSPKFEIKKMQSSTSVSHTIKTNIRRVLGLLRIQAYKTESVDDALTLRALPDYRPVAGGLKDRVNLAGVNHTFHYLVIGE